MNTFHGAWSIAVVRKDSDFAQRFTIVGSDGLDGAYDGIEGVALPRVAGGEWKITLHWSDNAGSGWQESATQLPEHVSVLTPESIVAALREGYRPRWHGSAEHVGQ